MSYCKKAIRPQACCTKAGAQSFYGTFRPERQRLPDGEYYAGERASACALLEAAISHYEEAAGLKSAAVKSALRRAEQLLATLPDEDRQKVGFCCSRCACLASTNCAGALKTPTGPMKAPEQQDDDEALISSDGLGRREGQCSLERSAYLSIIYQISLVKPDRLCERL